LNLYIVLRTRTVNQQTPTHQQAQHTNQHVLTMASTTHSASTQKDISLEKAFVAWRDHNRLPSCDTEIAVLRFLRDSYPNHHVTSTNASEVDLFGFARAGHATKEEHRLDSYDAIRSYSGPPTRLEGTEGTLNDRVRFGRCDYHWKDDSFIVYRTSYYDSYHREMKMLFVLSPISPSHSLETGHHPATDRLLLAAGEWTQALHDEIYVFDDMSWNKDAKLFKAVQGSSWDDVIIDANMKRNLMHDVQGFFDNRALYERMQVPWKRGVILHGVPGNGKTISIKALINSLAARSIPSLYVKSLDSCSGPKWSIQRIFKRARKMAPCLLVFEDLDSMVEDKTRSYFLNEVDGLESNEGILMIGSTNHLDRLDSAITKRPSRFDRKYHFKVPGEQERITYCRYWASKFEEAEAMGFCEHFYGIVARLTDGFSFAYLKELFVTSLLALARESSDGDFLPETHESSVSDNDSSSDGIVVEASTLAEEVDETGATKSKEAKASTKTERVMPEVEVPDSLKENKLLKAMLREAKTLWEQMDNSEDKENEGPKVSTTKPGRPPRGVTMTAMQAC